MKWPAFIFLLCLSFNPLFASEEVPWSLLQELDSKSQNEKTPEVNEKLKSTLDKPIYIKGFMLPMDYSAREIQEFLLMPYIPACIHVPPPPPNQVIHVTMQADKKAKASFYPVKVMGVLSVESNEDFESSYKMKATKVEELK